MKLRSVLILLLSIISSAAFGYDLDIHAMVVGDKVLELVETNPITSKADGEVTSSWISPNGKWVAYTVESGEDTILRLVDSDGGKPMTLIAPDKPILLAEDTTGGLAQRWSAYGWMFSQYKYTSPWSKNSKLVAVAASRTQLETTSVSGATADDGNVSDGQVESGESWIIVFDVRGKLVGSFCLETGQAVHDFLWSGDGRSFAAAASSYGKEGEELEESILVFDVASGLVRKVHKQPSGMIHLFGWTHGGSSILYWARMFAQTYELRQCSLDGSPERVVMPGFSVRVSPDGKHRVISASTGTSVEEIRTGKKTDLSIHVEASFAGWTTNSKFFFCGREQGVDDLAKCRTESRSQYWLVSPEAHGLNHLCLTADGELYFGTPTTSYDCLKMAYTSRGRVHLAKMAWRDPTPWEKLAAGLPLDEEDKRAILVERANEIGSAVTSLIEYGEDGNAPSEEDIKEKITEDLDENDKPIFFLRPGEHTDAFTYAPPDGSIENPETTVVGYLDAGYSWKVNIYADGHAAVVQKE